MVPRAAVANQCSLARPPGVRDDGIPVSRTHAVDAAPSRARADRAAWHLGRAPAHAGVAEGAVVRLRTRCACGHRTDERWHGLPAGFPSSRALDLEAGRETRAVSVAPSQLAGAWQARGGLSAGGQRANRAGVAARRVKPGRDDRRERCRPVAVEAHGTRSKRDTGRVHALRLHGTTCRLEGGGPADRGLRSRTSPSTHGTVHHRRWWRSAVVEADGARPRPSGHGRAHGRDRWDSCLCWVEDPDRVRAGAS